MPLNLENSAVSTGLEKVSFHSNPKERQYQRMFKLLHNCTHLILPVILFHESMEQIVVEILRSGAFEARGELSFSSSLSKIEQMRVQLGAKRISVSRISVHKRFFLVAASDPV